MTQPFDFEKYTTYYIKLRAKIKEEDDAHEARMKDKRAMLQTLNGMILAALNQTNQDSANVRGVGTVYKKTKVSVSLADPAAFKRHVVGAEDWDLLDWKANSTAVKAFMEENNGQLPPGVNYSTKIDVGVRKA